jgi:AcrR family transcriptional regulator
VQTSTASRERVLNSAEQLFNARGYTAVSMRNIADSLAMRKASLYYHAPEGKEQLYVEVALRNLRRHQNGIAQAVAATKCRSLEVQLFSVSFWLMDNAPLRLLSMLETDIVALSREHAEYLIEQAYQALFTPIATLFRQAQKRGEIRIIDPAQLAGYFLSLMDGISYSSTSGFANTEVDVLIRDVLDIFLNGLYEQKQKASKLAKDGKTSNKEIEE